MRFTLKYRGEGLLSAGNASTRKHEKQALRAHFHKQLIRIWANDNGLRLINRRRLPKPIKVKGRYDLRRPLKSAHPAIRNFLFREKIWTATFVPLITGPMEAHCHLALRVGRPIKPGSLVFDGGDLDGRLKTLFDALAMPQDANAVDPKDLLEKEYVCLLSDDELITGLSIESYELLEPGTPSNYMELDIAVNITAVTPMRGTLSLLYG